MTMSTTNLREQYSYVWDEIIKTYRKRITVNIEELREDYKKDIQEAREKLKSEKYIKGYVLMDLGHEIQLGLLSNTFSAEAREHFKKGAETYLELFRLVQTHGLAKMFREEDNGRGMETSFFSDAISAAIVADNMELAKEIARMNDIVDKKSFPKQRAAIVGGWCKFVLEGDASGFENISKARHGTSTSLYDIYHVYITGAQDRQKGLQELEELLKRMSRLRWNFPALDIIAIYAWLTREEK